MGVSFSVRAERWLAANPDQASIVYNWGFRLLDGAADEGKVVPGYQPVMREVLLASSQGPLAIRYATYRDQVVILAIEAR